MRVQQGRVCMNVRITAMAMAAAAVALGTSLSAQNVPSQFVVSGKAAEQIQDFTTINLATAERIAEACEKLAAAQGVAISIMTVSYTHLRAHETGRNLV